MKFITILKDKLLSSRENLTIVILGLVVVLVTAIVVYSEAYESGRTFQEANWFGWRFQLTLKRYDYNAFLGAAGAIAAAVCLVSVFIKKESKKITMSIYAALMTAAIVCVTVAPLKYCFLRNEYFDAGDTFCYFLGPKYFNELGYSVHYECTGAAQIESKKGQLPKFGRDLRTNTLKPIRQLITPQASEMCRERFSKERWQSFVQDVATYRGWHGDGGWQRRFRDHGYNGTPVFQAFAGVIANHVPLNHRNMVFLSLLNLWMVMFMLAVVIKAFGWRFGLLMTVMFWSNFTERWFMGSSFMRHEWVMAIGLGLACMKLKRYELAGALFAFAAGMRLFPVLLFAGIGLAIVWDLVLKRGFKMAYRRFVAGAAVSGVLLFILSISHGHGMANWYEFMHQMELNSGRFSTMRIGFIYNFMWPREFFKSDHYVPYEIRLANLQEPLLGFISLDYIRWIFTAVIIGFVLRHLQRFDNIAKSTLVAFLIFFMTLSTVHYYYSLFLGMPFVWHRYMDQKSGKLFMTFLLGGSALAYVVREFTYYSFPYNTYFSVLLTLFWTGLIVYFEWIARRERLSHPRDVEPQSCNEPEEAISAG